MKNLSVLIKQLISKYVAAVYTKKYVTGKISNICSLLGEKSSSNKMLTARFFLGGQQHSV